jgi:hypothetical protein
LGLDDDARATRSRDLLLPPAGAARQEEGRNVARAVAADEERDVIVAARGSWLELEMDVRWRVSERVRL